MLKELKEETNYTQTENGDISYNGTGSYALDFFALGGALRTRNDEDIISLFLKAFSEHEILALRILFYFRDIRNGQGERRTFRVIMKHMAESETELIRKYISLIPEFGRWDDLYVFVDTPLEKDAFELLKTQFMKDKELDEPSLLAKWLKSENASSNETKKLATKTRLAFGLSPKQYRKDLSELRNKINVVEKRMSDNEWKAIEYSHVPSKASLIYREAFKRHDPEGYQSYIDSVSKGEKKINTGALYPHEIAGKAMRGEYNQTIEELWKNLPNYVKEDENAIVVADVSGSMNGTPMDVSVSLAMYFAERNKGPFKNHFITFSQRPELIEITGRTLRNKFMAISRARWDMNTNIMAVYDLILKTAVRHELDQNDLPKRIYVISDMQFDQCVEGSNKSTYRVAKENFDNAGYTIPEIVFWNVDARHSQVPTTMKDVGTMLVSGFSPVLFKQIVTGKSAYELMLNIVNNDRYKVIR